MDIVSWAIAGVGVIALLLWLYLSDHEPTVDFERPMPPPVSGPHTMIARGKIDEGYFVLVRTPLYEQPLNASLVTQILFDKAGHMSLARYIRVATLETGKLVIGHRLGRPLIVTIGPGDGTGRFADDPASTWTH